MKEQQISIKSEHNHEPGNTTRRPRQSIVKRELKEEEQTEIFEIIQL